MKNLKRVLCLVLSVLLIAGVLAGCTNGGGSSESTAPAETKETKASEKEADTPTTAPAPEEVVSESLPLCEEKTTISIWIPHSSNISNQVDNIGETAFFKELEERTNVHVEFQHPSAGGEAQAFNLMISSGELPDMIMTNDAYPYPGGLDQAVTDGYYMDLTDLVPKYCPNYLTAMNDYASQLDGGDMFLKSSVTEDGRIVTISQIFTKPQGDFAGWYIRKDWLDDLGLDVPVTYDDWENVLTQFKEKKGATAPMLLYNTGYDFFNNLPSGFGVNSDFFHDNGTIKYGPMLDGWKEYLIKMNDWYNKGLIDPDFMSSSFWPDPAMIVTGKSGCFFTMYTLIAMYENGNEDENAEYIPITSPVLKAGDRNHFGTATVKPSGMAISADSKNAELCLRWLNYLFSEEGALFANYGNEGDTFTYVDGVPTYTEKVTANEQYSFSEAMSYYTMPPSYVSSWQDWSRELAAVPAKDIVSYDVWASNKDAAMSVPTVTTIMNSEESSEYAKIYADVSTIMGEATTGFISGTKSFDEWDAYVENMKAAGADRMIEIVQGAYDRFMSR